MLRRWRYAASVFEIALIGDDADHVVGVKEPEDLTREYIKIAVDINLNLTVRKDQVVGRARDSVAEKYREGARLETAMVDVYKRRMLYSDEDL